MRNPKTPNAVTSTIVHCLLSDFSVRDLETVQWCDSFWTVKQTSSSGPAYAQLPLNEIRNFADRSTLSNILYGFTKFPYTVTKTVFDLLILNTVLFRQLHNIFTLRAKDHKKLVFIYGKGKVVPVLN
jgi:hypothetical protein